MSSLDYGQREEVSKLLANPLFFPDEFKRWMGDFVATNVPLIPYSHIFGARHNIGRSGQSVTASETPSSSVSYVDMTTVGPQITNIADGTYLVMYGARGKDRTSISVNGATPSDDDSIWGSEASPAAGRQKIVSLKNNNENTVKLQYKGTTGISRRWLCIMRLGAP